jgi:hypothetical protein
MTMTAPVSFNAVGTVAGLDHATTAGDELAVQSASGFSNSVGQWNLAGSGLGATFSRVVNGANADLPAALGDNTLSGNPSTELFRVGSGLTVNDVVTVYSSIGASLGSITATGASGEVSTSGFASGDTLLVVNKPTTAPGQVSATQDLLVGPYITAASKSDAQFCDTVSDVLTVTFNENVLRAAGITGAAATDAAELQAILGTAAACTAWVGTTAVGATANIITFTTTTVGTANFVTAGLAVPGTVNANITHATITTVTQQANVFTPAVVVT